jgi:hypothetical protein
VRTTAQFFCSTCAPSLLLPGRERVKVIWRVVHQSSRWWLMNSDPLSLLCRRPIWGYVTTVRNEW